MKLKKLFSPYKQIAVIWTSKHDMILIYDLCIHLYLEHYLIIHVTEKYEQMI